MNIMHRKETIIVFSLLIAIALVSLRSLTTTPQLWFDEAINIQFARNFAEQGYLNLQTAPGIPYNTPYQFMTSGYALSLPLGFLFKFFGFSFTLARIYMLGWFMMFLCAAYLLTRRLFGFWPAISSLLLLATFAPIVSHARSIIGEIPGVTLILFGCWMLDHAADRRQRWMMMAAGLLFGAAIAAKPLYMLIIPALGIGWLYHRSAFSYIRYGCIGLAIPIFLFFESVLPSDALLHPKRIVELVTTYNSRANHHNFWANIGNNLSHFFQQSSLAYTLGVTAIIIIAAWSARKKERLPILTVMASYAVLALLFYLQSPGWNRYLIPYQVFMFLFAPIAIIYLAQMYRARWPQWRWLTGCALILVSLIALQTYQLRCCSDIVSGNTAARLEDLFSTRFSDGGIYVVSNAEAAAMIPSSRVFQFFRFEDQPVTPNSLADLDTQSWKYIFGKPKDPDVSPYLDEIQKRYVPVAQFETVTLFKRRGV